MTMNKCGYCMKRKKLDGIKGTIRMLEGILEVAVLAVLYYLFWRYGYDDGNFPAYLGKGKYVLGGVYALLVVVLFYSMEGFQFGYLTRTDVFVSQLIALFMVNFVTYWQLCLVANVMVTPVPILALMVVDVLVVFVSALLFDKIHHSIYVPKDMVLVFGSDNAVSLKFKMEGRQDKYRISRLIPADKGIDYILKEIVNYDGVIINDVHAEVRNDILKFCYRNEIRTYIAPKLTDIIVRGAGDISLFDTPLLLVRSRGLTASQRFWKRLLDLVLSLIATVLAMPFMLLVALAIKIEDGGPVFYKQKRVTLNGREFDILKFRSMIVDAEKPGQSIPATDKDPRITRVGRVIRATRLDELPQLLNILRGEMSIVGPRPERVEHVEQYSRDIPEFGYRMKVKGGLTGYAQIYGKYNTSAYDKLRLDMLYIENYSFLLDIKLIVMTVRILLKKESTEGFDKSRQLEELKEALLEKENREKTDEEKDP